MENTKSKCFFLLLILIIPLLTGCWNYREIDKLAIAGGMAIDKGENNNYLVTIEIIDLEASGGEVDIKSKRIQMEGETIFDAVRNIIKVSAKKLYWIHTKVIIISKYIAEDGVIQILDWLNRDAEPRLTLNILVSKEETAKELLSQQSVTTEIRSFEIEEMFNGQKSLSESPNIEVNRFINDLAGEGISAVLPTIAVVINEGRITSELSGTAVFKADKLKGFLNEEETKYYLFITDEIKGGVITLKQHSESGKDNITLEILENKTRLKPEYKNGNIIMNIDVNTKVAIGEQSTKKNYAQNRNLTVLKNNAKKLQEKKIKELIKKVQMEYDADIFGFGRVIKREIPDLWKQIGKHWDKTFKEIDVKVNVFVDIKSSGLSPKAIKVGD